MCHRARYGQQGYSYGLVRKARDPSGRLLLPKKRTRPDRTRAAGQARLAVCFGRFSLDACSGLAAVASAIGKVIRCRYD